MSVWISDCDVPEVRIQAGAEEAIKTLAKLGVAAEAAHAAMTAMLEGADDFDRDAAEAWENAETAAFRVTFAGLERWPESATLVLR